MYYHGSNMSGIKTLYPNLSLHGKEYVYLTTNKAVALIYTVNAIESFYEKNLLDKPMKFHPWYSYGFNKDLIPVIDEYYPNATMETYSGKTGYIYICKSPKETSNPTNIYCAAVTTEEVTIVEERLIDDVYEEILKMEEQRELIINRYNKMSDESLKFIHTMIKQDIEKYDFKNNLENNYSIFLRNKFPFLFYKK